MTFMVNFTVDGEPVGKGRPRFARQGGFVRAYTPAKTVNWEQLVSDAAKQAMGSSEPLEGSLALSVRVYKGIPASWSKKKRQEAIDGVVNPHSQSRKLKNEKHSHRIGQSTESIWPRTEDQH